MGVVVLLEFVLPASSSPVFQFMNTRLDSHLVRISPKREDKEAKRVWDRIYIPRKYIPESSEKAMFFEIVDFRIGRIFAARLTKTTKACRVGCAAKIGYPRHPRIIRKIDVPRDR